MTTHKCYISLKVHAYVCDRPLQTYHNVATNIYKQFDTLNDA